VRHKIDITAILEKGAFGVIFSLTISVSFFCVANCDFVEKG